MNFDHKTSSHIRVFDMGAKASSCKGVGGHAPLRNFEKSKPLIRIFCDSWERPDWLKQLFSHQLSILFEVKAVLLCSRSQVSIAVKATTPHGM